jgi:hypothetical protein
MIMRVAFLGFLVAVTTPTAHAFVAKAPLTACQKTRSLSYSHQQHQHQQTQTQLSMSLQPLYDTLCSKVSEQLGLQATDFCETYGAATWQSDSGAQGTAAWLSEASPKFLTGVSTCTLFKGLTEELTINVWMGPSYDIPHMLLSFGADDTGSTYHVSADYVPRGANQMGSDPQYMQAYYNEQVLDAWTAAAAAGSPLAPAAEFESRVINSPAKIAVTGLTAARAQEMAVQHTDRFLGWVSEAQPVAARLRGSFNLRDDKLRQFYYRGQVGKQVAALGPDLGMTVAAVNTGPTAEAYVGGGS